MLIFLPFWLKTIILLIVCLSPFWKFVTPGFKDSPYLNFFHFIWFMPFLFSARLSKVGLSQAKNIFSWGDRGWLWLSQIRIINLITTPAKEYYFYSLGRMFLKRLWLLGLVLLVFI
jgi:hypothetical protein